MTPDVNSANRRSKHDHGTPAGTEIADAWRIRAFDLVGAIVYEITIAVRASNALSVNGSIGDYAAVSALLDNARDAVRAYKIRPGKMLTVPGKDLGLPIPCARLTVEGPVDRVELTTTTIDRVRAELDEQHPLEAEHARAAKARIQI